MFGNLRTAAVKCETLSVEGGGGSESMHPPPLEGDDRDRKPRMGSVVLAFTREKQEAVGIATGMVL